MSSALTSRLAEGVLAGSRAALSRAITLVESTRRDHGLLATELLSLVAPVASKKSTVRLGISGQPGAGKSTLIEALGCHVVRNVGRKVAVLAVDPSSKISHGSILGDKTRMPALSREPSAYVRPSPSSGALGGLARRTDEAIIICEAAGYDVIFLETVGVGQSESKVGDVADMVVVLVPPSAGDSLQGSKKGILEHADLVVISKSDGVLLPAARQTRTDYATALSLQDRGRYPFWSLKVLLGSAQLTETQQSRHLHETGGEHEVHGPAGIWRAIESFVDGAHLFYGAVGFNSRRSTQREAWMWQDADMELAARLREDSGVHMRFQELRERVLDGSISARQAARELVEQFTSRSTILSAKNVPIVEAPK